MADTITMPKLGFDMAEGTLVRWVKKVGETVNKGEVLAEIETDKATVEVESTAAGVVRLLLVEEGAVVPVNSPIAVVGTADEKVEAPKAGQTEKIEEGQKSIPGVRGQEVEGRAEVATELKTAPVAEVVPVPAEGPVKASPLARKIARERSVDLSQIRGSGPGGRIVRRDIEEALQTTDHRPLTIGSIPSLAADETVGMSKLRQAIARRMAESKSSIPHFYVTHEYKMDALMDLRSQFNKIVPEDEKLSVNDFIVKAAALTLRQFPNLNASLNGNSVMRHGQVNVGIAVSVEGGLLTIVCREADQKALRQISAEVKAMAARVRALARSSRMISKARPFPSPIWACMTWRTSLPSSIHPKRRSWRSARRARCRWWTKGCSGLAGA